MKTETQDIIRFSPHKLPKINKEDDGLYTVEVGVVMENEHFTGYVEIESEEWYIDLGGITMGHRQFDKDEIEYWYYKK